MSVNMFLDCEYCGTSKAGLVPARFHYSDGCYTILAIDEQKCGCEAEKEAEAAARRARVARSVRNALRDPDEAKHSPDCQGTCCGGLP